MASNLPVAGIDGNHLRRSVLQQAVGEAAGRCADVEAHFSAHIHLPVLQSSGQLQASPAHKGLVVAQQANRSVVVDTCSTFVDLLLVHQHTACEDERLRPLPRRRQTAQQNQLVEPHLHAARLA